MVPLCGSSRGMTLDPFFSKEDAAEAVARIEVVDRGMSLRTALNLAARPAKRPPNSPKRLVLVGDQQGQNWVDVDPAALADFRPCKSSPSSADRPENTWIESSARGRRRRGAQSGSLDHRGGATHRRRAAARPSRDIVGRRPPVATQTVTVPPSEGARQVVFQHVFSDYQPEADRPVFVPIHVSLAPDQLPEDDQRFGIVPVVAELPVVFVDQYADDEEDRALRRFGETRWLRTLLSDATRPDPSLPSLVKVRHVRLDRLTRDELADARLVIVAGVRNPAEKVDLLREYVEQGGQLILAAGGDFDAGAWSESAWRNGAGLLPGPLQRELLGVLPEQATAMLNPFQLVFESLRDEYFGLPNVSPEELRDLYDEPLFFQVVDVDLRDEVMATLRTAEREWLERQSVTESRGAASEATNDAASGAAADSGSTAATGTPDRPEWLRWRASLAPIAPITGESDAARKMEIEKAAELRLPGVLARVSTPQRSPLLVDRRIGHGRVVFMASGVFSTWNTLPDSAAMFVFERLAREMIASTLPPAQFPTLESIKVALPEVDPDSRVELLRAGPAGSAHAAGLRLHRSATARRDAEQRLDARHLPHLRLARARRSPPSHRSGCSTDRRLANRGGESRCGSTGRLFPLALNGPARESDLAPLPPARQETLESNAALRWLSSGEAISLEGCANCAAKARGGIWSCWCSWR